MERSHSVCLSVCVHAVCLFTQWLIIISTCHTYLAGTVAPSCENFYIGRDVHSHKRFLVVLVFVSHGFELGKNYDVMSRSSVSLGDNREWCLLSLLMQHEDAVTRLWVQSARHMSASEQGTRDTAAHACASATGTIWTSPGSIIRGPLGSKPSTSSTIRDGRDAVTRWRHFSTQTVPNEVYSITVICSFSLLSGIGFVFLYDLCKGIINEKTGCCSQ